MTARNRRPAAPSARAKAPALEPLLAAPPAWVDSAVVAVAFAALAAASWGRWADPFIDFGREIYLAWRISEGETLYRDLAYFNGPFSPHLNALWLRLAGVSTWTLYGANLIVVAATAALLHAGLRRLFGRLAALVGALVFLGGFAFAQLLTVASFNFVAPYSHEMTHGTLLALVALAAFHRWSMRGTIVSPALAGGALGLLALGKPEFAIAAGGALIAGWAAATWTGLRTPREAARGLAAAVVCAALPPVVAWAALRRQLGGGGAFDGILGAWRYLGNRDVRGLAFYRNGMGLDTPWQNLASAASWSAGIVLALTLGWWLANRLRRRHDAATAIFLLLAPGTALFVWRGELDWGSFARPLPIALASAVIAQLVVAARARRRHAPDAHRPMLLAASTFALLLLLKMLLNSRLHQYGFALAMPGAVLASAWLVGGAPQRFTSHPSAARWFRLWCASLALGALAVHLAIGASAWRGQRQRFASGRDLLVADAQAAFHALVSERLRARLAPGATLAVVPEGVMVNYLGRWVNPTPYVNFMPPELLMFGEQEIVAAFREAPPDFLLLLNRDAADYGMGMIGRDHGRQLMAWIQASYELVEEIREPTSAGRYFSYGILLRRKAAPAN